MTASPIPDVPGLFAVNVVMMGVPESARVLVVGADPADPARADAGELARRYAEWCAEWEPVAEARTAKGTT